MAITFELSASYMSYVKANTDRKTSFGEVMLHYSKKGIIRRKSISPTGL